MQWQLLQRAQCDPKDSILVKLRKLPPIQCISKYSKEGMQAVRYQRGACAELWGTQGSLTSRTVFQAVNWDVAQVMRIRTHCKAVLQCAPSISAWIKRGDNFVVMDVNQRVSREWLFIVFHKIRHRGHPEFFCVCPEFLEALVEIEYRKDRLNNNSPFCSLNLLAGNGNSWIYMKYHFSLCCSWPSCQPGNLSVIFTQA